jgi:hypothetical protein
MTRWPGGPRVLRHLPHQEQGGKVSNRASPAESRQDEANMTQHAFGEA